MPDNSIVGIGPDAYEQLACATSGWKDIKSEPLHSLYRYVNEAITSDGFKKCSPIIQERIYLNLVSLILETSIKIVQGLIEDV